LIKDHEKSVVSEDIQETHYIEIKWFGDQYMRTREKPKPSSSQYKKFLANAYYAPGILVFNSGSIKKPATCICT